MKKNINKMQCDFQTVSISKSNNKKSDKTLELQSSFNFDTKKALLTIWNEKFGIINMSIKVYYMLGCSNEQKCCTKEVFNHDVKNRKYYEINIANIDRHVLENEFTVNFRVRLKGLCRMYISKLKFHIPFFRCNTPLERKKMKCHNINKAIENLNNFDFKEDKLMSPGEKNLLRQIMTYYDMTPEIRIFSYVWVRYALDIETCSILKDMEMENVKLNMKLDTYNFKTNIQFKDDEWKYYSLCLIPMNTFMKTRYQSKNELVFSIEDYKNSKIYFLEDENKFLFIKKLYHISFLSYSASYQASVEALSSMNTNCLLNYFLDFDVAPAECPKIYKRHQKVKIFKWLDKRVASNNEQMMAIRNIVNCTAYPFPFIIFGPPGTGKTSTLIESVVQILLNKPQSRILITAQSNSACDEIGDRLIKAVDRKKVFRFYSLSQLENQQSTEMRKKLLKISNLRNNDCNELTYEEIYYFNVVIVTLISSNQLIKAELKEEYFDYIFIDECASAAETECLVPIIGMGTSHTKITTNLVFLGDHKQLGPVIHSKFAEKLGLGVSLMERMMTKKRYEDFPSYDNNYIIQLLDNYRNHPAILLFPNVHFYDSKLRAKAPHQNGGEFPIVFHCIKKPSKIEFKGTSSYNDTEVIIVKKYVDDLLRKGFKQLDIGIISPYKAQLSKLRKILGELKDIETGTAEYYQGREKIVIIISTVKSRSSVGFLKSEKRFNVMLTRAKSKLIIVGNPETLLKDQMWRKFINYCDKNDAFVGKPFKKKSMDRNDSLIQLTKSFKDLELVQKE